MAPIRRNRKEGTAQLQDAASSGHADRVVQETIDDKSQQSITELSLEQVSDISLLEHNKPCLSERPYNEHDLLVLDATSSLFALEKNPSPHPSKVMENVQHEGASTLGVLEKNPSLRPCRVMGNVRQQGTSASEATAGPVGESEAMRKWREIKQNGFLSDPHGGMPTQPPEPVKKKRVRRPGVPLHPPGSMPMPHPQHGKGSVSLSHLPGSMPMPPAQYNKVYSFFLNPPGVSHPSEVMQLPPLLQGKGSSFLSHPQTGIVIPPPTGKQHDAKQSKRKEVDLKRNTETTKREQADKFKSAPPTGLLSGLNIGVIRRIRNPKEVSAILEAMVQPENPDAQMQSTFTIQVGSGSNENEDAAEDPNQFTEDTDRASLLQGSEQRGKRIASDNVEERSPSENTATSPRFSVTDRRLPSATTACSNIAGRRQLGDSSAEQAPSLPLSAEWRGKSLESHDTVESICRESTTSSLCMLDHNKKLPLVVTTPSEIITMACGSDFSTKQENIFTLTKKGTTYAFQWLEFLHKDIKGRLTALQHSKKRVTEAIYKRFPVLASSELPCLEASSMFWQCSGANCLSQWMNLFSKFHGMLCQEEKVLEKRSREIQDMLLHCEIGLKFVNICELLQSLLFDPSEQFRRSTKAEDLAGQHAVQARCSCSLFYLQLRHGKNNKGIICSCKPVFPESFSSFSRGLRNY